MTGWGKLYKVAEAAEILRVSVHTLYRWSSQKKIPVIRLSNMIVFAESDLNEFIAANRDPATAEEPQ